MFKKIFLFYHEVVFCVYSLELPHWYTQHTVIVEIIEKNPEIIALASWLTLSGSNYPYLEQIFIVPKMFKPLKFD